MAEFEHYAFPKDIVQLSGTNKQGRVLDWASQIPMDQREFSKTHYAVQPIDHHGDDAGHVVFWPQNGVMMVKRHMAPRVYVAPEDEVRF